MRRRTFSALLGAASTAPLAARTQPAGRLPRVALLSPQNLSAVDPRQIEEFKAGLVENKLLDGSNVVIEYHWADGSTARHNELTQTLGARGDLDVIVTTGPQALRNLMATGTKIPIVLAIIGDPMVGGFIKSLSRPGGTVTGLSTSNIEFESKRLELLKAAAPALTRVMVLHELSMLREGLEGVERAAHTLGVELLVVGVSAGEDLEPAFAGAIAKGANGAAVMASGFLNFHRKRIIELANRHRLPSVWHTEIFARDGGLLSYGPNFPAMYRRSAAYVAKILKGAKPADLPVEQPTRFDLVINLRTAKLLGLELPHTFVALADEVIE